MIFINILDDLNLDNIILIVDILDKYMIDWFQFLDFFIQISTSSYIKWIVLNCNWSNIEEKLDNAMQEIRIYFELNKNLISVAICSYIQKKTG